MVQTKQTKLAKFLDTLAKPYVCVNKKDFK